MWHWYWIACALAHMKIVNVLFVIVNHQLCEKKTTTCINIICMTHNSSTMTQNGDVAVKFFFYTRTSFLHVARCNHSKTFNFILNISFMFFRLHEFITAIASQKPHTIRPRFVFMPAFFIFSLSITSFLSPIPLVRSILPFIFLCQVVKMEKVGNLYEKYCKTNKDITMNGITSVKADEQIIKLIMTYCYKFFIFFFLFCRFFVALNKKKIFFASFKLMTLYYQSNSLPLATTLNRRHN